MEIYNLCVQMKIMKIDFFSHPLIAVGTSHFQDFLAFSIFLFINSEESPLQVLSIHMKLESQASWTDNIKIGGLNSVSTDIYVNIFVNRFSD